MSCEKTPRFGSKPDGSPTSEPSGEGGAESTRRIEVSPQIRLELAATQEVSAPPRSRDTLLPPAQAPEHRPSVPPLGVSSSGFATRLDSKASRRFPSVPPSIRPSTATVPPRARATSRGSVVSSFFWGALAAAFGASAGAVYWELAEEPHSERSRAASVTRPPSFANMPPMERRRHERVTEWLPVRLDAGSAGLAVTHNVSETGALLVTGQTLEVGQIIRIIAAPPDSPEITVEARVVRFAPNAEDPEGLWPYSVAVEFDPPNPELEAALRRLAP